MSESKLEWLERVAELHGLDPEDIEEIAELCLEDTEENINVLSNIEQAADMDTVIRAAHSIKGSAANIGLNSLSDAAKTIEARLNQNNLSDLETNLDTLKDAFQGFRSLLNN